MPSFLKEWRNGNEHRNFPLTDESSAMSPDGAFRLPQSLIVDLRLDIPHDEPDDEVSVVRVVVAGDGVFVHLSHGATPLGYFHARASSGFGYEASFVSSATGKWGGVSGVMAFGRVASVMDKPGSWEILDAIVNPACVRNGPAGVRALIVDNTYFYGDVVLRSGDNVDIVRTTEGTRTVLTISSASVEDTGAVIKNNNDLVDYLVATYGRPITSVNGVVPSDTGEFFLRGADCVGVSNGDNAIIVANPCGDPCCDKDEFLARLYDAIDDLNVRAGRLQLTTEAVEQDVITVQNKLGLLHSGIRPVGDPVDF